MNKKFQTYLDPKLDKNLRQYCAKSGKSISSVTNAAIRAYLDETTDTKLLFRRLDKHTRALAKANRDIQLMAEALSVFVKLWFAHTPRIPDNDKENAQRYAAQRYEQFCDYVATQISGGHYFVDDLVQDSPISEDELDAAREDKP
ncbi:[similarity to] CopG/DNA-binding domain-containing protein [methanotrophic bacterial endosymbiont of Bathymodiolus sp.]|jgi:hypothetical protein|uniref:hypothetical protein n=1 Tax=Bacteria TaxID=2 RepID=UPI0008E78CA8|nr:MULTISPECIES: hypothetical protein [Bacteria]SHE23296.1 CopG domain-containing protein [methanotrophic endosymbiont of Bathymodiolus puteoserpentis (Logatchev)]SMG65145.1 [similarity to] CopG/DNA-binding domain-containing protein [methanotrophic bacterial endosymbiont of Bathymodiolus sp.]